MSADPTNPDPGHNPKTTGQSGENSDNQDVPPAEPKGGWEEVQEEYKRVVKALNRRRVSFTARSAEGITLYGGLDSHKANGNMRSLAEIGHIELLERIQEREAREAKQKQEAEQSEQQAAETPGPQTAASG